MNKGNGYGNSTLRLFIDYNVFEKDNQWHHRDDVYLATGPAEIIGRLSKHFGKYGNTREFIKGMAKPQLKELLSGCSVYEREKRECVPLLDGKKIKAALYLAHVSGGGGIVKDPYAYSQRFEFLPE